MSRLSFDIDHDSNMWGDGTRAVFFSMLVDNESVDEASVDPDVFFEALTRDGRHPLLMCPTGEFGCCGSWARTRSTDESWRIRLRGLLPETDLTWPSVIGAGQSMLDAIQLVRDEHGLDPYVPSRATNAAARLNDYRSALDRVIAQHGT